MLPADDRIRLQHMLEAARKALELSAGRVREDLDTDEQLSLALQRLIEILGEAAPAFLQRVRRLENPPSGKALLTMV